MSSFTELRRTFAVVLKNWTTFHSCVFSSFNVKVKKYLTFNKSVTVANFISIAT